MNTYIRGQRIKCTVIFRDVDSQSLVDPPVVTFRTLNPNGVATDYIYLVDPNVLRESAGNYRYDLLLNIVGDWFYGFIATGGNETAAYNRVRCCTPPHSTW
jgi:hypothetical protein